MIVFRLRYYLEALALTVTLTALAHGANRLLALHNIRRMVLPGQAELDENIEATYGPRERTI